MDDGRLPLPGAPMSTIFAPVTGSVCFNDGRFSSLLSLRVFVDDAEGDAMSKSTASEKWNQTRVGQNGANNYQ